MSLGPENDDTCRHSNIDVRGTYKGSTPDKKLQATKKWWWKENKAFPGYPIPPGKFLKPISTSNNIQIKNVIFMSLGIHKHTPPTEEKMWKQGKRGSTKEGLEGRRK